MGGCFFRKGPIHPGWNFSLEWEKQQSCFLFLWWDSHARNCPKYTPGFNLFVLQWMFKHLLSKPAYFWADKILIPLSKWIRIIELQLHIPCWKGPTMIIESKSWLHTGPSKNEIMCLRALIRLIFVLKDFSSTTRACPFLNLSLWTASYCQMAKCFAVCKNCQNCNMNLWIPWYILVHTDSFLWNGLLPQIAWQIPS